MASGKKRFTQAAGFEQLQKHVGLYKQAFTKEDGNGSRLLPCVRRKPDGKGGQHQPRTHVHGTSMASFKRFTFKIGNRNLLKEANLAAVDVYV